MGCGRDQIYGKLINMYILTQYYQWPIRNFLTRVYKVCFGTHLDVLGPISFYLLV